MPRPARTRPQSAPPLRVVSLNTRSGRVTQREVRYEAESTDDLGGAGAARKARIRARPPRPRRTPPRPATPVVGASPPESARPPSRHGPELTEGKRRDYGYGVPQWSPYYRPPHAAAAPPVAKPSSTDYGYFPPSQSLSPALQMRSARANIREMKGRATVDHMWEAMGHRPAATKRDLDWIAVAREQAALEAEHWVKAKSPAKDARARAAF